MVLAWPMMRVEASMVMFWVWVCICICICWGRGRGCWGSLVVVVALGAREEVLGRGGLGGGGVVWRSAWRRARAWVAVRVGWGLVVVVVWAVIFVEEEEDGIDLLCGVVVEVECDCWCDVRMIDCVQIEKQKVLRRCVLDREQRC